MKRTCVSPNVKRSKKLRGTQHSPELPFRSTDPCVPDTLILGVQTLVYQMS